MKGALTTSMGAIIEMSCLLFQRASAKPCAFSARLSVTTHLDPVEQQGGRWERGPRPRGDEIEVRPIGISFPPQPMQGTPESAPPADGGATLPDAPPPSGTPEASAVADFMRSRGWPYWEITAGDMARGVRATGPHVHGGPESHALGSTPRVQVNALVVAGGESARADSVPGQSTGRIEGGLLLLPHARWALETSR